MTPAVLSLTACFVSLVCGIYQSGRFIYKGQMSFTNRQSVIKEIVMSNDANELIHCGSQCVREPTCLAIEMCPLEDRQLCRLCNSTNPSLTDNETDSCRHLQLDCGSDVTGTSSKAMKKSYIDCADILRNEPCADQKDGVYTIYFKGSSKQVFCDMTTEGGGWTVIQRNNMTLDFDRNWIEYKNGFGNASGEYWIGNEEIHYLTTESNQELRVDLTNTFGTKRYAKYSTFKVYSELSKYKLMVGGSSRSAGDGFGDMKIHHYGVLNGMKFSTKHNDNDIWDDGNCASTRAGGWWYRKCYQSLLNTKVRSRHEWRSIEFTTVLQTSQMMIRPKQQK